MGCHHSCTVSAPTGDVWATLRDFHDFGWAKNVIETCEKAGDAGPHDAGAVRLLNGVFKETLLELDDENMTLRYSIDEAPGTPVHAAKDYVGTVRLRPGATDGTTSVEWTSEWSASEGGVAEFCNPIYEALLAELQKRFV